MSAAIKDPTLRKVRNRGYEPVRYQLPNSSGVGGYVNGWIVKRGRKLIHVYVITFDRIVRVPLEEERYMTPLL